MYSPSKRVGCLKSIDGNHQWRHGEGETRIQCHFCGMNPDLHLRSKCKNCMIEVCVYCLYEKFQIDRMILLKPFYELSPEEKDERFKLVKESVVANLPKTDILHQQEQLAEPAEIIPNMCLSTIENRIGTIEARLNELERISESLNKTIDSFLELENKVEAIEINIAKTKTLPFEDLIYRGFKLLRQ